jgi:hypothetical protein
MSKVCSESRRIAIICTCFYQFNLIYESCSEKQIKNSDSNSIIELGPLNRNESPFSYFLYVLSSLFLDAPRFATTIYHITIKPPPQEIRIIRFAPSDTFVGFFRTIYFNSNNILINNSGFNNVLDVLEDKKPLNYLSNLIINVPKESNPYMVFRQAIFMSTRRKFENGEIKIISDENIIEASGDFYLLQ